MRWHTALTIARVSVKHLLGKNATSSLGVGILAGAVATGAMSLVMLRRQRSGKMGELPPKKITEAALDTAGIERLPERTVDALSVVTHFGFGAASGGLFALVRRGVKSPSAIADGVLFGTVVWLSSYAGWVPALGIMPPPDRDRPGRPSSMLLAHWVYGGVLGALVALGEPRLRR